ncbi:aminopeptidase P family protein [Mangrovibacterium marinum]|uniref:Xaa-Pro aminopeptidase n=1 Tax=Mangrovibacterium marinum TaxID=1639118 RepID=A0A2T5BYX1_9BACT|nr:aminopeptidase P family protein [Mangrovibacterium marinum]PTN07434.1 Xaa-Pro aminopeptidase [Mangrovibacterium marinum]
MFKPEVYAQRREALCRKIGSGLILFLGNEESPMNYADNTYHFRQDSSFLYYFGVDFPSLAAVIDVDNQQQIIFGNDFTIDDIVWMGSMPTIADRAATAGITETKPTAKLHSVIAAAAASKRTIHFLPAYRPGNLLKLQELLHVPAGEVNSRASVDLIKAVVSQRELKSPEEIAEIEIAVDLSVDMHVAAMKAARPGVAEAQVAARVAEIALAKDGNIAFPIIATINGQTLHNHSHHNMLKAGDLFLLDAGAETNMHYAGDLSSTCPVSDKFTDIQTVIYEASLRAHEAAIAAIAPGIAFKEVHRAACLSVAESMKALGLMKGDIHEAVEVGAHALFFPCGTGHQMGLDVHDMEDLGEVWVGYDGEPKSSQFGLKSLRLAKQLRPGHVFTVEPGIYFIPDLMDLWKAEGKFNDFLNWDEISKFRNFGGIRNEEDFLITETGCRRLGKQKPKTIADVYSVRN